MSEETEFESVGSENWKFVRLGAQQLASRRLQNRYDAVKQGVSGSETKPTPLSRTPSRSRLSTSQASASSPMPSRLPAE